MGPSDGERWWRAVESGGSRFDGWVILGVMSIGSDRRERGTAPVPAVAAG